MTITQRELILYSRKNTREKVIFIFFIFFYLISCILKIQNSNGFFLYKKHTNVLAKYKNMCLGKNIIFIKKKKENTLCAQGGNGWENVKEEKRQSWNCSWWGMIMVVWADEVVYCGYTGRVDYIIDIA